MRGVDGTPTAARSGDERANRFMMILLGVQRLSYAVPPLVALGSPANAAPP